MNTAIGADHQRKEAWDKVTGSAKYTDDTTHQGMLHAKLLTSPHAHAKIISVKADDAKIAPGVKAVITGNDYPVLCGPILADRPPLAKEKIRYYGEPVAMVVAETERQAMQALKLVDVEYEQLPVVNSLLEALKENPVLIHENMTSYTHVVKECYPEPNTNIPHRVKIRKGDMARGWAESEVIAEGTYMLPQCDHVAMETRCARCKIMPSGDVIITTSTQAPVTVKEMLHKAFDVGLGKIVVHVPFVGGGFGGKAPVQLEFLAYMASKECGGREVVIANTREEDLVMSPCKIGVEAKIKFGANRMGILKAVEMTFHVDGGAYTDIAPGMAKAIAVDCLGAYLCENIQCDVLCVYTNHPYTTSFRSFGHLSGTFGIERTMDKLAYQLDMDPWDLRMKNAVVPGHTSPTQIKITKSNTGNLPACLERVRELINWNEGMRLDIGSGKIRAKGLSCFMKTSNSPTDAVSGVQLTFNSDGSININSGVVEMGPGMKTTLAIILAERLKMRVDRIHVRMEVDTRTSPNHWKTVASMTTYMAGNAVLLAAESIENQIKSLGAIVLRCSPQDLDVANEKVFLKYDPLTFLEFKDIAGGYKYDNGNSIMGQLLGEGSYIMTGLTGLDKETGKGKAGPYWTVGAQAVEVEFDTEEFAYRLVKAATVVDAGKVLNPKTTRGVITGAMCMGLGVASREEFIYNEAGHVENTSLRSYKVMHAGEEPTYLVDYVETPNLNAPYGARGLAEHGIIGMPSALANALSSAAGIDISRIPITPEYLWITKTGGKI